MILHKNHGAKCVVLVYARIVSPNQMRFALVVKKQNATSVKIILHPEHVICVGDWSAKIMGQRRMNQQFVMSVTNE